MVVFVVMGVCGSGKTTLGKELASELQCSFRDADDFHSPANKAKMSSGVPLTDQDRIPWLLDIHEYVKNLHLLQKVGIVTCSALKRWYRQIILSGEAKIRSSDENPLEESSVKSLRRKDILFVYLCGSKPVLQKRLDQRHGHFMPAHLLDSQLQCLEEPSSPENFYKVDIDQSIKQIVHSVVNYFKQI